MSDTQQHDADAGGGSPQPAAPAAAPAEATQTTTSSTGESGESASASAAAAAASSPSHEATSAAYSSPAGVRGAKGMSLNLNKLIKPAPVAARSAATLTIGRGGKTVAATPVALGVSVPKPKNLPSMLKENNGVEYGVPIVPAAVIQAGTWRAQADAYQQQHNFPPRDDQFPTLEAPHAAAPPPQPKKDVDHAAQKQMLEQELGGTKGPTWAADDSDEEMDYSTPVVFADGTTTVTPQQRQQEEAKRRAAEIAEKQREAAERERVRQERAAAQAQQIAQQRSEQMARERQHAMATQSNPIREVLGRAAPGAASAWGRPRNFTGDAPPQQQQQSQQQSQPQQHSRQDARPHMPRQQQQDSRHDAPRQQQDARQDVRGDMPRQHHEARQDVRPSSLQQRSPMISPAAAPTMVLSRSNHGSPSLGPAASPNHAASNSSVAPPAAALPAPRVSVEDQPALMKELAQRRKQEREAEILRLEQEKIDRAKQKLAELERKQAEKLQAAGIQVPPQPPRQLFEPSAASSSTSKFEASWRHEKVGVNERNEYDRGFQRPGSAAAPGAKGVKPPPSALAQAAHDLLEKRTVTHPSNQPGHVEAVPSSQQPQQASQQQTAAQQRIAIMQRPKGQQGPNADVAPPPLHTITSIGGPAPLHADGKKGARGNAQPAAAAAPLPASARITRKEAPVSSKPEPNWRDESRVKQQSQPAPVSHRQQQQHADEDSHKKGGGGGGPRPRIWADDLPDPNAPTTPVVNVTTPHKAAPAPNVVSPHPAHTITMLGEATLAPPTPPTAAAITTTTTKPLPVGERRGGKTQPAPISINAGPADMPSVVSPRSMRGRLKAAAGGFTPFAATPSGTPAGSAVLVSAADATAAAYATPSGSPAVAASGTPSGASIRGGRGGATVVATRGGRGGAVVAAVAAKPAFPKKPVPGVNVPSASPVAAASASPAGSPSTPEAIFEQQLREKRERDAVAKRAEKVEKVRAKREATKAARIAAAAAAGTTPSASPAVSASPAATGLSSSPVQKSKTAIIIDGQELYLSDSDDEAAPAADASDFQKVMSRREMKELKEKEKLAQEAARIEEDRKKLQREQQARLAEQQAAAQAKLEANRKSQEEARKKKADDREAFLAQKAATAAAAAAAAAPAPVAAAAPAAPTGVVALTIGSDMIAKKMLELNRKQTESTAAPTSVAAASPKLTPAPQPASVVASPVVAPVQAVDAPVAAPLQPLTLTTEGSDASQPGAGPSSISSPPQQPLHPSLAASPNRDAMLAMALLNAGGAGGNAAAAYPLMDPQQQMARLQMQMQQMQLQVHMPLTPQQIIAQAQLVGLTQGTMQQLLNYNSLLQTYGVAGFLHMAPQLGLNQHAIQQLQLQLNLLQHNHQQQLMRERAQQQAFLHHMQQQQQLAPQLHQQPPIQQAEQAPISPANVADSASATGAAASVPQSAAAAPSVLKSTAPVFSPSAAPFYPPSSPDLRAQQMQMQAAQQQQQQLQLQAAQQQQQIAAFTQRTRLAEMLSNVNLNTIDLAGLSPDQIMALRHHQQQQQMQQQMRQIMQAQQQQQQQQMPFMHQQQQQQRLGQVGSPIHTGLGMVNPAVPVTPTPAAPGSGRSSFSALGSSSPVPVSFGTSVDPSTVITPMSASGSFPAHPSMPLRAGHGVPMSPSVHAAPIAHTPAQTFTAPLVQTTTPTPSEELTPTHAAETKPATADEKAQSATSPLFRSSHPLMHAAQIIPGGPASVLAAKPADQGEQCQQQ